MNMPEENCYAEFLECYKLESCILIYCLYMVGKMVWNVVFVLPQFKSIFMSMNVELPLATRCLLELSELCNRFWPIIFPLGIVATIHVLWSIVAYLKKCGMGPKGIGVRAYAHLVFIGTLLTLMVIHALAELAVYMPMLRLINTVG